MTDPTARALTLLGLLEHRPTWTGGELAARLGVTERTLRRDVDRLRQLGYTVDAAPGAGGGYTLGRGQLLPPLPLDEPQGVAVTLALVSAAQDADDARAEAALHALATLDAVMPSALRERLAPLRDATQGGTGSPAVDIPVLLACAEAVRGRRRLRFVYRDRFGRTSQRDVEPHQLLSRGRVWQVVAHCRDRADWRTFRLDRITAPQVSTMGFTPRPDAEAAIAAAAQPVPPEAHRHVIRLHVAAPPTEVEPRFSPGYARLTPLCPDVTEVLIGADDPVEAARWIAFLDLGEAQVHVVGDAAVRRAVDELAGRLTAAL